MRLLVDVGNTRIKWALQHSAGPGPSQAQAYTIPTLPRLLEHCWHDMTAPRQVCIANVGGVEAAGILSRYCRERWQQEPAFARVQAEQGGVINAYTDIGQLGIDRWLAIVAAWNKYHAPLLVAGCGTALTLDAVDGQGRHLGGLIIPGLRLLQDSLQSGTRGIAAATLAPPALGLGTSTAECIAMGAANALVSTIERVAGDLHERFGTGLRRLIMGGDAAVLNGLLQQPFTMEPSLVLEGLALSDVSV